MVAILGSKTPNIQNLAVGGVANAINLDNQATLNMDKLYMVKSLLDEVVAFVQQVYVPDVCAIGAMYPEWLGYGAGVTNYLAVPDLPARHEGHAVRPARRHDHGRRLRRRSRRSRASTTPTSRTTSRSRSRTPGTTASWQKHPFEETTDPEVHEVRGRREVLLGQGAALPGQAHAGGAARPGAGRLRGRPRADEALGRPRAQDGLEHRQGAGHAGHAALDARAATRRGPIRTAVIAELAQKHWKLLVDEHRARATPRSSTRRSSRRARCAASASTRRRAARCRTGP